MPFSGSGVFTPAVTFADNTDATAEDQNTQDVDIANGLTACMTRAGLSAATANWNMGGFKLTGLGAGSSSQDSVAYGQISFLLSIGANTVLGNNTGSSAAPAALSQAQLTALINAFTSLLPGSVPASGGGTTNFLRADGSWAAPPAPSAATTTIQGLTTLAACAIIQEQQASGQPGSSYTSGTATCVLNTIVSDPHSIITSLTSNEFILAAGSYLIEWSAPFETTSTGGAWQSWLQDITGSATVGRGNSESSGVTAGITIPSRGAAIVSPASSNTYAIQLAASAAGRIGNVANIGTEVYTNVTVTKLKSMTVHMTRNLIALSFFLIGCSWALAQTSMTRAQLENQIVTDITTNGQGQITGAILNKVLQDQAASTATLLDQIHYRLPICKILRGRPSSAIQDRDHSRSPRFRPAPASPPLSAMARMPLAASYQSRRRPRAFVQLNASNVLNCIAPNSTLQFDGSGKLGLAVTKCELRSWQRHRIRRSSYRPEMPSCSGASNALIWTTSGGFGCNTISGGGSGTELASARLSRAVLSLSAVRRSQQAGIWR